MNYFHGYRYTFLFVASLLTAIIFYAQGWFDVLIQAMGNFGYLGAFAAGMGFGVSFTTAPSTLFFVDLGAHLNPYLAAVWGGLGAAVSDLLLYKFLKDSLFHELKAFALFLIPDHHREKLEQFTEHWIFMWTVPFLASLLIASPLPDEIGIALFGIVNFRPKYLSVIAFILNAAGILALVLFGNAIA